MRTSPLGLAFIKHWEGCILQPYRDQAGYRTIGIGHLIKPGEDFGPAITDERALQLLASDVLKCELAIDHAVTVALGQHQFDALVSWSFNCGTGVLHTSTLVRQLNLGRYDLVPGLLLAWDRAGGRERADLRARRAAEGHLWGTADVAVDGDLAARVAALVAESLRALSAEAVDTPEPSEPS